MSNIPSNEQIRTALDNAYAYAKTVQGGKNASYIPALAQVPSDLCPGARSGSGRLGKGLRAFRSL